MGSGPISPWPPVRADELCPCPLQDQCLWNNDTHIKAQKWGVFFTAPVSQNPHLTVSSRSHVVIIISLENSVIFCSIAYKKILVY